MVEEWLRKIRGGGGVGWDCIAKSDKRERRRSAEGGREERGRGRRESGWKRERRSRGWMDRGGGP